MNNIYLCYVCAQYVLVLTRIGQALRWSKRKIIFYTLTIAVILQVLLNFLSSFHLQSKVNMSATC